MPRLMNRLRVAPLMGLTLLAAALGACGGGGSVDNDADILFHSVSSPPTAESGGSMPVAAVVWSEAEKYNVYLSVALQAVAMGGQPALYAEDAEFDDPYDVGAFHIPSLLPGEEYGFLDEVRLPDNLPGGHYRVVFKLNAFDFTPEDDHLQSEGEEKRENNTVISPTPLLVIAPTLPQLKVLHASIDNPSFYRRSPVTGDAHPAPNVAETWADGDFGIALEVGTQAVDVDVPVQVLFELDYPDGAAGTKRATLQVLEQDASGNYLLVDDWAFPVDPETGSSLKAGIPMGKSFQLYVPDPVWTDLEALPGDAPCALRVVVDPNDLIPEHDGLNLLDNQAAFGVVYLAADGQRNGASIITNSVLGGHTYPHVLVNEKWNAYYGKEKYFKAGPEAGTTLSYGMQGDVPTQYDANAYGQVSTWVFGHRYTPLFAGADVDYDLNNDTGSRFVWEISSLGVKQFGDTYPIGGSGGSRVIWSKEWKTEKKAKASIRYWLGPVPLKITGGLEGEIGIGGKVELKEENVLALSFGPEADLKAFASAGVDMWLAGGSVGVTLTLLDVSNVIEGDFQVQTDHASFTIQAPLDIHSMNGSLWAKAYLHYLFGTKHWHTTILKWRGKHWEYNYFHPHTWTYPSGS